MVPALKYFNVPHLDQMGISFLVCFMILISRFLFEYKRQSLFNPSAPTHSPTSGSASACWAPAFEGEKRQTELQIEFMREERMKAQLWVWDRGGVSNERKAASIGWVFNGCPKKHQDSTRCFFFRYAYGVCVCDGVFTCYHPYVVCIVARSTRAAERDLWWIHLFASWKQSSTASLLSEFGLTIICNLS